MALFVVLCFVASYTFPLCCIHLNFFLGFHIAIKYFGWAKRGPWWVISPYCLIPCCNDKSATAPFLVYAVTSFSFHFIHTVKCQQRKPILLNTGIELYWADMGSPDGVLQTVFTQPQFPICKMEIDDQLLCTVNCYEERCGKGCKTLWHDEGDWWKRSRLLKFMAHSNSITSEKSQGFFSFY